MYKLTIAYDGTNYLGWQKTKFGKSIQETIEKALLQITQNTVQVEAASRTDKGVHAEGQVIQFSLSKPLPANTLLRALNATLPVDIRVLKAEEKYFHPTLDAIKKEYHYKLDVSEVQDPTKRLYAWHIFKPLDLHLMRKEAQDFIGTFDFSAFANECEKDKDPICTIYSISITDSTIKIVGDRFLYKMVRNMVGTLVSIGLNKPYRILDILQSKKREKAALTAPALGLYLHQVFYDI